jgi:hypothetical protein
LDISKVSSDVEIQNPNHVTSTGYTLGFWLYSSHKDLSTSVLRIYYEDHFMITVNTKPNLFAHCFIGLDYYNIVGNTSTSAAVNDVSNGGNNVGALNFKKIHIDERKWRYLRCGYSSVL